MLEIGSLLDRKYKILNKIGQGGMSVVYLAMNEKANKQWAVKEVRKDGVKDFAIVKQGLVAETEFLKRLNHPGLPSVIDVIEDEKTFLIVMDYIEGNPLSVALEEQGALPQDDVIEWAKQLCDVLGYLHTRKPPIIYRDMKPSNVMLRPDGTVTLIDFGTARTFKEDNLADTTCLGTLGYAAPEQFTGINHKQTDARTDIYCLGATLYHLVTGSSPCEPPYEILPIREVNPALSPGLEKILLRCTQKNPDLRYSSCAELMYDLERFDKIDDTYRRGQKRKLRTFALSAAFAIVFLFAGFTTSAMAAKITTDTYYETISEAQKATGYDDKVSLYMDAIAVQPGETEAYLALIDLFKEDNGRFTLEEERILTEAITKNRAQLTANSDEYGRLSFEVAKLYWYYYDYGDTSDNRITRMKTSVSWFDDALQYTDEGFENRNMATIYRDIGVFYRDIAINTVEASDRGTYQPLWENMIQLLDVVEQNEDEGEIVKLELYELCRSTIQQYASKLKGDGVEKQEVLDTFDRVDTLLRTLNPTTDITAEKQQTAVALLEDTRKAIELAYGNE